MKASSILIALVFFRVMSIAQDSGLQIILDNYLQVKEALVKSDALQSADAAKELITSIRNTEPANLGEKESESFATEKESLLQNASLISEANDVEEQRKAFAELSAIMWKVVKDAGSLTQNVYYMYCPMKKVYWLSAEEIVRNPYYGSVMLTCGSVSDSKTK